LLTLSNRDGVMTVASGADSNGADSNGSVVEATHLAPGSVQGGANGSAHMGTGGGTGGGVTITVTGPLAADMIGRGETERREREMLAGELRERLDAIETALVQKAAEQQRLEQSVQALRSQLAQLDAQATDQVSQLRTDLGRMRGGFVEVSDRFRDVQGRLDRLESAVESVHVTVGGLEGAVESVKSTAGSLDDRVGSLGGRVESLESAIPPRRRPPLLTWRKSLHFWAAVAAVTLTATAGAVWLYA
jgi:prefoldin subunit 5